MLFSKVRFGFNKRIKQMFEKDEIIYLSYRDAIMHITFLYWAIFVKFVPVSKGTYTGYGYETAIRVVYEGFPLGTQLSFLF